MPVCQGHDKKKRRTVDPCARDLLAALDYFRCLLTSLVISNMLTVGLATEDGLQRVVGLDHALVLLVLQAVLLDVGPELLGDLGARDRLLPTTSASAALGVTGFMNAAFALRAGFAFAAFFFAVLAICSPISHRSTTALQRGDYYKFALFPYEKCAVPSEKRRSDCQIPLWGGPLGVAPRRRGSVPRQAVEGLDLGDLALRGATRPIRARAP